MKHAKLVQILSPFLLLLMLAATNAHAGALPPPEYRLCLNGYYCGVSPSPGSYTETDCYKGLGCLTFSESAIGTTASASVETSDLAPGARVVASVTYYWEAHGHGGSAVPVTLVGSVSTSATGPVAWGTAEVAEWTAGAATFMVQSCSSTTSGCGLEPPSVSITQSFSVDSGQINYVSIGATAVADGDAGGSETASATADPVISIDPTWLATHPGYSLEFSPGITNGATPEPSSLLLLGSGLLSLGYGLRRRLTK